MDNKIDSIQSWIKRVECALPTIEVEEFCCGFSLRTGTLILLWTILIIDSFTFWMYLNDLLYDEIPYAFPLQIIFQQNIQKHHLIGYILGIITSVAGIISIQKNVPKYLICSFLYFCYYVVYYFVGMVILIISPKIYKNIIWVNTDESNTENNTRVVSNIFVYIFFIGLMLYFAIIVKSCKNAMLKNHPAIPTRRDIEIPELQAVCNNDH